MTDDKATAARRNFEFQKVIAGVGLVLMLGKFFAYCLTDSVSILTDAMESIVNVVAGFIGLYALWLSMKPADRSHPYGHGKVELISSSIEGTLIVIAGLMIIIESVDRILNPSGIRELDVGIVIVIIAAAVNFAMGMTAVKMGRRSDSIALEASGKHLCTDTYSSVGIIIGLSAVLLADWMGYDIQWVDPLMALLFGVFIIFTGLRVIYRSFNGIMDRADEEIIRKVVSCMNKVRPPEVIDIHHLRVVRYGASAHIDAHMLVPYDLTVGRVTEIEELFTRSIIRGLGQEVDITFQAESCLERSCLRCPKNGCEERNGEFVKPVYIGSEQATDQFPPSWVKWPDHQVKHK